MKIYAKWKLLLNILLLMAVMVPPGTVFAACASSSNTAQSQVLSGVGETGVNCSGAGVNNAVNAAVTVLSIVVGFAAIIMILLAGFRYITSGGDSAKVTAAKNALIYAMIGILIAGTAQFIIHFVLYQSNKSV
jgi:hypothetical protein